LVIAFEHGVVFAEFFLFDLAVKVRVSVLVKVGLGIVQPREEEIQQLRLHLLFLLSYHGFDLDV